MLPASPQFWHFLGLQRVSTVAPHFSQVKTAMGFLLSCFQTIMRERVSSSEFRVSSFESGYNLACIISSFEHHENVGREPGAGSREPGAVSRINGQRLICLSAGRDAGPTDTPLTSNLYEL